MLAGKPLARALACLSSQTYKDFETIIVDNSASGAAAGFAAPPHVRVLETEHNLGFGGAVNRGIENSQCEFICTLNDDAYPAPEWLESLVQAANSHPEAGMFACQIRLASQPAQLDSAGLGIYADGTTKQRGHREPASDYSEPEAVLIPSACAALYRRAAARSHRVFRRRLLPLLRRHRPRPARPHSPAETASTFRKPSSSTITRSPRAAPRA